MKRMKLTKRPLLALLMIALGILLTACGTTMSGHVLMPDGSRLSNADVLVYTKPWTDSVHVNKEGAFKIKKNVVEKNDYTIIAEDKDGNSGYIRGFKPDKGKNENLQLRMSREVSGKDAILEGDVIDRQPTGVGEKILKSSQ